MQWKFHLMKFHNTFHRPKLLALMKTGSRHIREKCEKIQIIRLDNSRIFRISLLNQKCELGTAPPIRVTSHHRPGSFGIPKCGDVTGTKAHTDSALQFSLCTFTGSTLY